MPKYLPLKAFGFETQAPRWALSLLALVLIAGIAVVVYQKTYAQPEQQLVSLKDANKQLAAEVDEFGLHAMEEPQKHELFEDTDGALLLRVYPDHCVMIQRRLRTGGVLTKLVPDLARVARMRGHTEGSFRRPSPSQAFTDGAESESSDTSPLAHGQRATFERDHSHQFGDQTSTGLRRAAMQVAAVGDDGLTAAASTFETTSVYLPYYRQASERPSYHETGFPRVPRLLRASSPATVTGTVRAVVVDSFDGIEPRRTRTHIGDELGERVPSAVYLNASSSVVMPSLAIRVAAAIPHRLPDPAQAFTFRHMGENIDSTRSSQACNRGCLNPHPGNFKWWYGQRNGAWVEVWRQWPEGCVHFQMFNVHAGVWDSNEDGTARVTWRCCVH